MWKRLTFEGKIVEEARVIEKSDIDKNEQEKYMKKKDKQTYCLKDLNWKKYHSFLCESALDIFFLLFKLFVFFLFGLNVITNYFNFVD